MPESKSHSPLSKPEDGLMQLSASKIIKLRTIKLFLTSCQTRTSRVPEQQIPQFSIIQRPIDIHSTELSSNVFTIIILFRLRFRNDESLL